MKTKSKKNTSSKLFTKKLFNILMQEKNKTIVAWTSSGETFTIKDMEKFSEKILPRHFKHKNFSSFVRVLNMYDFHKTKEGLLEYFHPCFKSGQPDLLSKIKRKHSESPSSKKTMQTLSLRLQSIQSKQSKLEAELACLQEQYNLILYQNNELLLELTLSKQREFSALNALNSLCTRQNPSKKKSESSESDSLGEFKDLPSI